MTPVKTFSPALYAHLADRVPKAAREASRRFPRVEVDDFEQEMWMRALASCEVLGRYLADGEEAFIWRKLRDYGHRYGMADDRDRRARKAADAGYNTYDEVFYTPKMVGHLVAELIQAEWDLPYAMDRATKGTDLNGARIQNSDDTHDSFMDYLALLTDVKSAYDGLGGSQQNILACWYQYGNEESEHRWEREAIAQSMGLTYNALELRKRRALSAMIYALGGESPYIRRRRGEIDA